MDAFLQLSQRDRRLACQQVEDRMRLQYYGREQVLELAMVSEPR